MIEEATKCKCGHFNIEHRIELNEFFSPVGMGKCSVCNCGAYVAHNAEQPEEPVADDQPTAEEVASDTEIYEAALIVRMSNNPDYLKSVLSVVLANRIEFLAGYMELLLTYEKGDLRDDGMIEIINQLQTSFKVANEYGILKKNSPLFLLRILRMLIKTRRFFRHLFNYLPFVPPATSNKNS